MVKRSYCLQDKPFPVGAKALRTLARCADGPIQTSDAASQVERLRRSGYVRIMAGMACITDAGRALLAKSASKEPA